MVVRVDLSSSPHVSDSEPERESTRQGFPRQHRTAETPYKSAHLPDAIHINHALKHSEAAGLSRSPNTMSSKHLNLADDPEGSSLELLPSHHQKELPTSPSPEYGPTLAQQSLSSEHVVEQEPPDSQSGLDEADESPESLFDQHLSSKFSYQKTANTTRASASAATNYFRSKTPSLERSSSSTSENKAPKATKKPSKRVKAADFDVATTKVLPLSVMGILPQCPVCKTEWTTKKSSAIKLKHTLDCAQDRDYDLETVRVLVEQRLRKMQSEEELAKLQQDTDKTLFDDVIKGAGQGVMRGGKKAGVQLIGLDADAIALTQGGTLRQNPSNTQVSREIDRTKKKPRANVTSKVGKAIKLLSGESTNSQPSTSRSASTSSATGRLQPYTQTKDRLAQKAQIMLASGPSSADPSRASTPEVSVADVTAKNLGHKTTAPASGQLLLQPFTTAKLSHGSTVRAQSRQVIEIDSDSDIDEPASVHPLPSVNEPSQTFAPRSTDEEELPLTQPLPASRWSSAEESCPNSQAEKKSFWALAGADTHQVSDEVAFGSILPSELRTPPNNYSRSRSLAKLYHQTSPCQMTPQQSGPGSRCSPSVTGQHRPFSSQAATKSKAASKKIEVETSLPDYSSWSLNDLKAEASKFGYKPPGTKVACVNLLTKIWEILHARKSKAASERDERTKTIEKPEKAMSATPRRESQSRSKRQETRSRSTSSAEEGLDSPTKEGVSSRKGRRPRISAASMADAGEDLGEDLDEGVDTSDASFEDTMKRLITKDKEVYLKVLRYQPVSFETFDDLANQNNLKYTAIGLRRFLDHQCITFYMEGPHKDRTRGASSRARKAPKATTPKKRTTANKAK